MAGLGEDIKVNGENYAVAKEVPQNTTAYTDALNFGEGGQLGAINVKGVVNEKIVLTATKKLTVKLQESATGESEDYADKFTVKEITAGAEDAYSITAGNVLFNHVLGPDSKRYTRLSLTTDDAAAAGKVDIYPQYLPR